jgi:LacI family transcriptional regulator
LSDLGEDEDKARARLESLTHRVDALVLTGCRTDTMGPLPEDAVRGRALGIPIIMLGGSAADNVDAFVEINYRAGVRAALDHLLASGRHRIAMIDSSHIASPRRDSYREYLRENGLAWTEGSEFRDDETHQGGVRAAAELIRGYPDADAVLVYNDVMAIGALKEFARSGLSVPRDIAVVGTDGLAIGALVTPELTSLSIDKVALAQHAIDLVGNILAGRVPGGPRERRHPSSSRIRLADAHSGHLQYSPTALVVAYPDASNPMGHETRIQRRTIADVSRILTCLTSEGIRDANGHSAYQP